MVDVTGFERLSGAVNEIEDPTTDRTTQVFVAPLHTLGLIEITSLTFTDNGNQDTGQGSLSGFDLDGFVISTTRVTNAAEVVGLQAGSLITNSLSADDIDFTAGAAAAGQNGGTGATLVGTTDSRQLDFDAVMLRDLGNAGRTGFVSMGQGGTITITFDAPIQISGDTFVYVGDWSQSSESIGPENTGAIATLSVEGNTSSVIEGDAGNNNLSGTAQNDTIEGFGGNDVLLGQGGDDVLNGGDGPDLAEGGPGNDLLRGQQGNDTLDGGPGQDELFGLAGNDQLRGSPGNDMLDGGAARDAVLYAASQGLTITENEDGTVTVTSPDGTDTLSNTETIHFAAGAGGAPETVFLDDNRIDKIGAVDDGGAKIPFRAGGGDNGFEAGADDIALLYEAALNRDGDIDAPGLNFWIGVSEGSYNPDTNTYAAGASYEAIAQAFIDSGEFEAAFGDPATLENGAFLDQLYANILGRDPDAGGRAFWLGFLDNGGARNELLAAFATSPENQAELADVVADLEEQSPGTWDFA